MKEMNPTVIGVSKRCCPVCTVLLRILFRQQQPMSTPGSHNTIYSCSLPLYLHVDVIQEMVDIFGTHLRGLLRKVTVQKVSDRRTSGDSAGFTPRSSIDDMTETPAYLGSRSIPSPSQQASDSENWRSHAKIFVRNLLNSMSGKKTSNNAGPAP